MTQTVGILDIYWNGAKIEAEKGATLKLSGYKNNAVNAGRKTHRAQEWMAGEAKCTTVLRAGDALTAYLPGAEGELQVKCDTGQVYTSPDAFIVDVPTVTGGEGGKVQITWNFSTYEELVS
jgi:hypothetical protein